MNRIQCELCGSNDLIKKDNFFECQNCGMKYSLEEAKKLLSNSDVEQSPIEEKPQEYIEPFVQPQPQPIPPAQPQFQNNAIPQKKHRSGFWVVFGIIATIWFISWSVRQAEQSRSQYYKGGSSYSISTSPGDIYSPATTKTPTPSPTTATKKTSDKLKEVTAPIIVTSKYGNKSIEGKLKNVSGKDITYAQIEFSVYDSSGALIGSAWANISSLKNGETWKYSAVYFGNDDDWKTAKLAEITAW